MPTTYDVKIYLNNTGEMIGMVSIQKLDIPLSSIRYNVECYLSTHYRAGLFCFMKDKSLVAIDTESRLTVGQICINQNNTYSIFVHCTDNQAYPSLSTYHYTPSYQPMPILSQPRPSPSYLFGQNSVLLNDTVNYLNETPPPNEMPLQRTLREARASGKIDEILNQPMTAIQDIGMDDAPRDLVSRNSSFFPLGSWENLYSGNGSMIFPMSRPGSNIINLTGSNLSIEYKDANFAYEDILNRFREREYDDADKGAPSI